MMPKKSSNNDHKKFVCFSVEKKIIFLSFLKIFLKSVFLPFLLKTKYVEGKILQTQFVIETHRRSALACLPGFFTSIALKFQGKRDLP